MQWDPGKSLSSASRIMFSPLLQQYRLPTIDQVSSKLITPLQNGSVRIVESPLALCKRCEAPSVKTHLKSPEKGVSAGQFAFQNRGYLQVSVSDELLPHGFLAIECAPQPTKV